jgi:hypothetical protein
VSLDKFAQHFSKIQNPISSDQVARRENNGLPESPESQRPQR